MKHGGLSTIYSFSCRPNCSGKGRCPLPVHLSLEQPSRRGWCHAEPPKPGGPGGEDNYDIDEVLRKLSSEAARMREQEAQQSSGPSSEAPSLPQDQSPELLVGEPRFMANDFVIYDKLGSLNVRTVEQSSVQASLDETLRKGSPTATVSQKVNIYSATYESGKPFQGPVTVLLKEYTPDTRRIGVNELVIASKLQTLPEDSELWKAATADVSTTPISTVLGWFESNPVESLEDTTLMENVQPAANQSLWLVCKFEGMQPAQAYLVAPVSEPAMKLPFMLNSKQRRHKMLRSIWTGCLKATAYVHAEGVVHESIGLGAFMMSTVDDAQADRLFMKLDNFGVSKAYTGASGPDSALAQGIKQDMEALAITFCELTFGSLAEKDPNATAGSSSSTSAVAFQRLVLEVFQKDVVKFREYCLDVEEFSNAVSFLDEVDEGGWGILDMLLQGSSSCQDLTEAPFLNV